MTAALTLLRRAASPYAKRLARERGIDLVQIAGSGPNGRIVAADVIGVVPPLSTSAAGAAYQASAIATTIALSKIRLLLADFAEANAAFSLDDVVLRAAGCALDDVATATSIDGAPIALETTINGRLGQVVFDDVHKGSLAPLHERRLAAIDAAVDEAAVAAALSVKLLLASEIRPVMMPLLPRRSMRLMLVAGETSGECLLVFDANSIDENTASEFLLRIKAYLEVPIRLLA